MAPVRQWSGREASALRVALRMTIRSFAEYLGISPRTVANWQAKGYAICPLPEMQEALDTALAKADPDACARFEMLLQGDGAPSEPVRNPGPRLPPLQDAASTGSVLHETDSTMT